MAEGNFTKARIEAYLGRTYVYDEIKLANDGLPDSKNYISYWDASVEKAKPTDDQLNALETEATKLKNNAIAVANRQKEYGSTISQLEYIVEHGVSAFIEKQNAIKTKYPKE